MPVVKVAAGWWMGRKRLAANTEMKEIVDSEAEKDGKPEALS